MTTYDFVHLAIHALGDQVRGKTKLQKLVYFLGELTGELKSLGYRPHYYGPYSSEVAGAVDLLQSLGFLDQSSASGGSFDRYGFEVARFDFRLNDAGKSTADTKAKKYPELWEKLRRAAEVLNSSAPQDYMKLSIAAKTYFMLGSSDKTTCIDDLVASASKFGWTVSNDQIQDAAEFLKTLKLVEFRNPSGS